MCLPFVFLLITRTASWLRLSQREEAWRTAEILILRRQPARRPATATAAPPEPELGGPGPARHPDRRDTQSAAPRAAAAGHPGHDPALAPRHRQPPLGHQVNAREDRPASDPPEHQGPGPPGGPREPRLCGAGDYVNARDGPAGHGVCEWGVSGGQQDRGLRRAQHNFWWFRGLRAIGWCLCWRASGFHLPGREREVRSVRSPCVSWPCRSRCTGLWW